MRKIPKEEFLKKLQSNREGLSYLELVEELKATEGGCKKEGFEVHHIHPRSLGGDVKAEENLLKVSVFNHCLLHYFLAKAIPCFETLLTIRKMSYGQYTKLSDIEQITLEEIYSWSELRRKALKGGFKVLTFKDKAYHIPVEDVDTFLDRGYSPGPPAWMNDLQGKGHKGHIRVNREGKEKFVAKENIQTFLDEGWKVGCTEQHVTKTKQRRLGQKCVYKGSKTRYIDSKELKDYLNAGWTEGRSEKVTSKLAVICRENVELRSKRIAEEANLRRMIYTKSSEFSTWWRKEAINYRNRPQYGVVHFLESLGLTKQQFLLHMKDIGEL